MSYLLGRIPSPPDSRDHPLSLYVTETITLPDYVSARSLPKLDQGATPQCVAFSGSLMRIIEERKDEHKTLLFDAPELYARCKEQDGSPDEDGTFIRVACKVLKNRGALVTASTRKSDVGTYKPVTAYAALNSLDDIKTAIYLYGSAWLGADWYDAWFTPDSRGFLPEPDSIAGGHAFTAVGYSDKKKALRIQNSWGSGWGDKGRAWLSYEFLFQGDFESWRTIDILND